LNKGIHLRMERLQEIAAMKKAAMGILPESPEPSGDLLEQLSAIEHEQWCAWSKSILESEPGLSEKRRARWVRFMVPYANLPESVKDLSRVYAKKVLSLIKGRLSV